MISTTSDGTPFNDFGRVPRNAPCPCGSGLKAKKCHEQYTRAPLPGLDGTYDGSCVLCMRGTDEVIGFWGEMEWFAAVLCRGGMSLPEVEATLEVAHRQDGIQTPQLGLNACQMCLICQRKLGLPKAERRLGPDELLVHRQPIDMMTLPSQFAVAEAQLRLEEAEAQVGRCAQCDKVSFRTERDAVARIKELWLAAKPDDPNPPHRAYECPAANGWHLTRKRLGEGRFT